MNENSMKNDKKNDVIEKNNHSSSNKIIMIVRNVFVVLILALIAASYILFNHDAGKVLRDERRKVAKAPSFTKIDGSFNDEFIRDTYEWIGDNLGLRRQYVGKAKQINKKIFKNQKLEGAEIGKDGWFYAGFDNNLKIAYGEYPLTDQEIAKLKSQQIRMKNWCEKRGIKYYLCIVPSKSSIYPEYILSRRCKVRTTPADRVYRALKNDVDMVDLKQPMLEAKKQNSNF